jgi:hypothetical protein
MRVGEVGLTMMRAIVLVLCLAAAGGIAVYTHYSRGVSGEVYTVPRRPVQPASPVPAAAAKLIDPDDRAALARALQHELKRVGCYSGEITGVWTTSSRMAMKTFVERVNAALPIDNPDPVLLSLVQGRRDRACGACPAGQTAAAGGACVPNAVLANGAREPADARPDADARPGAAAALALPAPTSAPKADARAPAPGAPRPVAATPAGPMPPEGMVRERRPRHTAEAPPRPPKVVRDVLKALGF